MTSDPATIVAGMANFFRAFVSPELTNASLASWLWRSYHLPVPFPFFVS